MTKDKLIKSIAMWCVAKATQETTSGNYIIYFDEILKSFNIMYDDLHEYQNEIANEILLSYKCVCDIELNYDYCFDITLYTDYCFEDIE